MPVPVRRFEWDDAVPGPRSDEFVTRVTDESIRAYAEATGDRLPEGPAGSAVTAPSGYVFVAAPQRRHATMASIGCRAPEQDPFEPRSTPYVGSDVRYFRPIRAGDTVRSVTVLDRKFERGGNRFVVFRVDASDEAGRPVAVYDYTCLWERVPGRTGRSQRRPASGHCIGPPGRDPGSETGPVLVKAETVETIAAYGGLPVGRPQDWMSTHTNEEFARSAIFGGAVNAGVATACYTAQWLDLVEQPGVLWHRGRLESRALAPVRAGDILQITGQVREEPGDDTVRVYEIVAVNQAGVTAFRSVATVRSA